VYVPDGAYYVMTDVSGFGYANDLEFAKHLVADVGVATVPGSSFYRDARDGSQQVRFAFCKKDETLLEAGRRLKNISRLDAAAD
jgi:aminotransferase